MDHERLAKILSMPPEKQNRLGAERIRLRLTMQALGEALGVSKQAISQWEQDVTKCPAARIIQLADLFGVSVDYLRGKSEIRTPPVARDLKIVFSAPRESLFRG